MTPTPASATITATTTSPVKKPGTAPAVSWVKTHRSPETLELIKASPFAFILLLVIALRARWQEGFNADGLATGEAFLGDYQNYGMSRSNYRSAAKQLQKWGFATITSTSRGTIGKLTDSRVFSVSGKPGRQPDRHLLANDSPAGHQPVATNLESIERKEGEEGVTASPSLARTEGWQLIKDRQSLTAQIRQAQEAQQPDVNLIAGLKAALAAINGEWRRRGMLQRAAAPSPVPVSLRAAPCPPVPASGALRAVLVPPGDDPWQPEKIAQRQAAIARLRDSLR